MTALASSRGDSEEIYLHFIPFGTAEVLNRLMCDTLPINKLVNKKIK